MHPSLNAMAAWPQWICWRPVPRGDGKHDKVPTDPATGSNVDPLKPASWMPAADAIEAARASGLGVGFVFTERDPFFFLDLDACIGDDGAANASATTVLSRLPGAAIETSFSGQGLHAFGSCAGGFLHSNKNKAQNWELYTRDRFVALGSAITGGWAQGDSGAQLGDEVQRIAAEYFAPKDYDASEWTDAPCDGYRSTLTDDKLIEAARRSVTPAQALGAKASFEDLWTRNVDALARAFPPTGAGDFDGSSADFALAAHLAFWTGKNMERIEGLMQRSALVRDKWERPGYLRDSIMRACGSYFGDVLGQNVAPVAPPAAVAPSIPAPSTATVTPMPEVDRSTPQMLFPDQQAEYFAGCIALPSENRVWVPGHGVLKPAGFRIIYDGPTFVLSWKQGAKSIRNSWEAFTGSEVNATPWAHRRCFRPSSPRIVEEYGERLVNTWEPATVKRVRGDATPFLEHVRKMLPDGDDAAILLYYAAALVQYQGEKFPWCPIVQSVEGNGKSSVLIRCIELAIGQRYVHQGNESQLKKDFNAWMDGSVFVVIDDIKITRNRSAAMERIKPIVTQARVSVERKGVDASTQDVCCNFWLNTNHQDALPLTANTRRFAPFFCAQQNAEDLERDGITQDYFNRLFHWLRHEQGFEIVADWLHSIEIPAKYNPSREGSCSRAPVTTATRAAVLASLPVEAQHIESAIHEGLPGFRGGWVSSIKLRGLFDARRIQVAPRAYAMHLKSLGYVRHPALVSGRTSRHIAEEGGRPSLYVRRGDIALNLTEHEAATAAYCKAQGYGFETPAMRALKENS